MIRRCVTVLGVLAAVLICRVASAQLELATETCNLVLNPRYEPAAAQKVLVWNTALVPVLVRTDSPSGVETLNGVSTSQVIWATLFALNAWNEAAGADIRLYYAGTTDQVSVMGHIVIGALEAPIEAAAASATQYADTDGHIYKAFVHLYRQTYAGEVMTYDAAALSQLLIHEFGHNLGKAHTDLREDYCASNQSPVTYASVMGSLGTAGPDTLKRFDLRSTQRLYGARAGASPLVQRSKAVASTTWSSPTTKGGDLMIKPGSLSQGVATTVLPVVELAEGPVGGVLVGAVKKLSSAFGTFNVGSITYSVDTVKAASTAVAPSGKAILVYIAGETENMDNGGRGKICYRRSSDWGNTFAAQETCLESDSKVGGPEYARDGAATAGYDPITDTFLIAWRSNPLRRIEIHIMPADASLTWTGRTTVNNTASTMPTIACSPTSYLGYPNCRLVYGAADAYHCLQWLEFRVNVPYWRYPARIGVSSTRTQCYPQFDTPHVVWSNGDSKFHLAFGQYGAYIVHYTMNATGTSWQYRSTVQSGSYPDDFISGPALSSEEFCIGSWGCSYRLGVFWLDYPN